MGAFANILAAIQSRIPTELRDTIRIYSDEESPQFLQGAPPSIAMQMVGDVYAGPKMAGPISTAATRVRFLIWAAAGDGESDVDATHELRRQLIVALRGALHGSYRLESGTWNTGGVMAKGALYTMVVAVDVPITRDAEETVVITSMPQTAEVESIEES